MSQPCGANGTSYPILAPQLLILILLFIKFINPGHQISINICK